MNVRTAVALSAWALCTALVGCDRAAVPAVDEGGAEAGAASEAAVQGPELGEWGIDLTAMDTAIKPGDDFYGYVNGAWQTRTEIPADHTDIGGTTSLQDLALDQVKTLLEDAAADTGAAKGSDRQKLGDWYASMLDLDAIESKGLAPLQAQLDAIGAIGSREQLEAMLAANNSDLGGAPISVGLGFDRTQVDKTFPEVSIGGLSIEAREVYLEPGYEAIRKLHREHIARMFELAGYDDGAARAARVQSLETGLAQVIWSKTQARDRAKANNPTPLAGLVASAPGIDWPRFLAAAGAGTPEVVNMPQPSAITGAAKLVAEAPLQDWRDYLAYHLLKGAQAYLPKAFRDENFTFYGKTMGGTPEQPPRWKVALADLGWPGRPLGDALGAAFVERYVPADARPKTREMVDNILAAFDARLENLEWMAPETRAGAREKLSKVTIKTIYPEVWRDTDSLEVVRGDALGNARRAAAFLHREDIRYLTEPMDRRIFFQPVYVVNAYAFPIWNEIVFLAAIVRPPAFDPQADLAVNYGAMGAVMGHEISHLFDDQGRQVDGDGLLRDWWTPEDAKKFVAVSDRLAAQVGSYEALPGKKVNGPLTLGESIADVAGLTVAYDAYKRALGGEEAPVVDGFTGDQRFFMAYAQVWRWKARDAYLDKLLKTDVHPPSFVRPQTVRNIDAWYAAFDVQPGDALYLPPEERVNPW